jgi:hypothetical protein
MIHSVAVILIAVATPFAASVRLVLLPVPASRMVSVVIAIVMTPAAFWFMKVTAVPIGKATDAFAGIVKVRAVVSALGCKMCFPESESTSV